MGGGGGGGGRWWCGGGGGGGGEGCTVVERQTCDQMVTCLFTSRRIFFADSSYFSIHYNPLLPQ